MATRRRVLAGAAATAAALGFPAIVRAAEKVTLITPFGFDSDFLDLMNAYSGGHFAKEGLDAKVLGASGTVQHIQQVIAGQVDFGRFSGIDFIRAVGAKDAPLKAIATVRQNSGFHVVSLKDKPVKTGADLKGKTVGILSYGGTTRDLHRGADGEGRAQRRTTPSCSSPATTRARSISSARAGSTASSAPTRCRSRADAFGPAARNSRCRCGGARAGPGLPRARARRSSQSPSWRSRCCARSRRRCRRCMTNPIGPILERAAKDFEIPGIKDTARS